MLFIMMGDLYGRKSGDFTFVYANIVTFGNVVTFVSNVVIVTLITIAPLCLWRKQLSTEGCSNILVHNDLLSFVKYNCISNRHFPNITFLYLWHNNTTESYKVCLLCICTNYDLQSLWCLNLFVVGFHGI